MFEEVVTGGLYVVDPEPHGRPGGEVEVVQVRRPKDLDAGTVGQVESDKLASTRADGKPHRVSEEVNGGWEMIGPCPYPVQSPDLHRRRADR